MNDENQETAIALIEMEENIGCGIIFDFAGNYGKRNGGNFRRCPDYYGSGADFR